MSSSSSGTPSGGAARTPGVWCGGRCGRRRWSRRVERARLEPPARGRRRDAPANKGRDPPRPVTTSDRIRRALRGGRYGPAWRRPRRRRHRARRRAVPGHALPVRSLRARPRDGRSSCRRPPAFSGRRRRPSWDRARRRWSGTPRRRAGPGPSRRVRRRRGGTGGSVRPRRCRAPHWPWQRRSGPPISDGRTLPAPRWRPVPSDRRGRRTRERESTATRSPGPPEPRAWARGSDAHLASARPPRRAEPRGTPPDRRRRKPRKRRKPRERRREDRREDRREERSRSPESYRTRWGAAVVLRCSSERGAYRRHPQVLISGALAIVSSRSYCVKHKDPRAPRSVRPHRTASGPGGSKIPLRPYGG